MTQMINEVVQNSTQGSTFGTDQPDKRRIHRRRMLKSGSIVINSGYSKFDCIVKNLNENGAMLNMTDATELPSQFELAIGEEGATRKVNVVWKHGSRIGLSFI